MPYFPQLATGAMGQYPLAKRRLARTVVNEAGDGRKVKLADAGAVTTEWRLRFDDLTDGEMETLHELLRGRGGTAGNVHVSGPGGQSAGVERATGCRRCGRRTRW